MKLTKYKLTLKSLEDTVLPGYLGSMLRGAFGEALMQYDEDLFNKFFKNKIDENSPVYKYTNETPPPPFIFNPLKKYEFIRKKQDIIFTLSLIGDYRHYGTSIPEIMQIMCENKMHNQKLKTEIKNIEIINNPLNNSKLFDINDYKTILEKLNKPFPSIRIEKYQRKQFDNLTNIICEVKSVEKDGRVLFNKDFKMIE